MPSLSLLLLLLQTAAPAASPPVVPPSAAAGPTQAAAAEQLARAEGRYRTALATAPNIAAYHESLALILEREGRLEEALASHQQAVRLDSLSSRNQAGFGILLLRVGRSAAAIPHLQFAAASDSGSVEVRKALAAALLDQGRRREALVALEEARQLDSSDSDIRRSIRQAEATAPGKDRLNERSATVDHPVGLLIRRSLEWLFGIVLAGASVALLVPLVGGLFQALLTRPAARDGVAAT